MQESSFISTATHMLTITVAVFLLSKSFKRAIRSIDEAKLCWLQQVMRYIGISDCKIGGSYVYRVNISVRPRAAKKNGTRTEIKNMNSINNIAKAMEYEFERQVDLIENGLGSVVQETPL